MKDIDKMWKEFLSVSNKGFEDVYNRSYCYDEMKILSVLEQQYLAKELPYEELFWLTNRCYLLWDAAYRYKHSGYVKNINSNMCAYNIVAEDDIYQLRGTEEEGYADAYAKRVGYYLLNKNKEIMKI